MDLMGLYPGNFKWVLVTVDKFTRWVELRPLHNGKAPAVIKCLNELFLGLGVPETASSDNGTQFTGLLLVELTKRWGI